jgi:hypothetical protein
MHRFALFLFTLTSSAGAFANQIHDQVAALSEEQRQGVLGRMLVREGETCPSVSRTFYQGSSRDRAAFWSVSCNGGKDWQIMIKDDPRGDIKILDCATMKALKGPACFTRFK